MEITHPDFFFRLSVQVVDQQDVADRFKKLYVNRIAVRLRLIEKRQPEADWVLVPQFRKKWYQNRVLFPTLDFICSLEIFLLDAGLLAREKDIFVNRILNPVELDRYRTAARITVVIQRWAIVQLNDFKTGRIPATEESIQALDEFKVSEVSEDCAICLVRPCLDVSMSRMPCSHIFHSECIGLWLRKSHTCPTCRFRMPIHKPPQESSIASSSNPPQE